MANRPGFAEALLDPTSRAFRSSRPIMNAEIPSNGSKGATGSASADAFVQALTLSWKRQSMYPEGHPARRQAMNEPLSRLRAIHESTPSLEFGIKEHELLFGEDVLPSLPAQELARRLYRRNVGVLRFERGITAESLSEFVGLLQSTEDGSLQSDLAARFQGGGLDGITVEDVDYSALVAAQMDDPERDREPLLDRLLRIQLGTQSVQDERSPERVLADLVERIGGLVAGGDVSEDGQRELDLFLDVLREALDGERTGGVNAIDLEQTAQLIQAFAPEQKRAFLARLLGRILGSSEEALQNLRSITDGRDLLSAVRSLRRSGVPFSRRAARLAEQLLAERSPDGGAGPPPMPEEQNAFITAARARLPSIDPWSYDEPQSNLLVPPSEETSSLAQYDLDTLTPNAQRQALMTILVETLERSDIDARRIPGLLVRLAQIFRDLLATGRLEAALALMGVLQARFSDQLVTADVEVSRVLRKFDGTEAALSAIEALRSGDRRALTPRLRELVQRAPQPLLRSLVHQMSHHEDRRVRRLLFDFLTTLGQGAIPAFRERLSSPRWFEVRNSLIMLRRLKDVGAMPKIHGLLDHPEERVRLEAARFVLRLDPAPPGSFFDRLLNQSSVDVQQRLFPLLGPRHRQAVPVLLRVLQPADPLRRQRAPRLLAIQALSRIGDVQAADTLAQTFESALRLQHADERRAFYESLVNYADPAVVQVLQRGASSRDATVRDLCSQGLEQLRRRRPTPGGTT